MNFSTLLDFAKFSAVIILYPSPSIKASHFSEFFKIVGISSFLNFVKSVSFLKPFILSIIYLFPIIGIT